MTDIVERKKTTLQRNKRKPSTVFWIAELFETKRQLQMRI